MWRFAIVGLLALPLAGCQTGKPSEGVIGAYQRTEVVRYNKRDYTVSFIYSDSSKSYDVKVRRPGRPMDGGASDRNNATQVASSTVSLLCLPHRLSRQAHRGSLVQQRPMVGQHTLCENRMMDVPHPHVSQ